MMFLKREVIWLFVYGFVIFFGGVGVFEVVGVLMFIVLFGVVVVWVFVCLFFFLGGMLVLFSYFVVIELRRIIKGIVVYGRYDVCWFKN